MTLQHFGLSQRCDIKFKLSGMLCCAVLCCAVLCCVVSSVVPVSCFLTLKMKVMCCCFKMTGTVQLTSQHHVPEYLNLQLCDSFCETNVCLFGHVSDTEM